MIRDIAVFAHLQSHLFRCKHGSGARVSSVLPACVGCRGDNVLADGSSSFTSFQRHSSLQPLLPSSATSTRADSQRDWASFSTIALKGCAKEGHDVAATSPGCRRTVVSALGAAQRGKPPPPKRLTAGFTTAGPRPRQISMFSPRCTKWCTRGG